MKKKVSQFLEAEEDNVIPNLEELKKVVACNPKCKEEVFKWWWDVVLPGAVGREAHWNKKVRYCAMISNHVQVVHGKTVPYISPSIEVFALLTLESNWSKWTKMAQAQSEHFPKKVKFEPKDHQKKAQ